MFAFEPGLHFQRNPQLAGKLELIKQQMLRVHRAHPAMLHLEIFRGYFVQEEHLRGASNWPGTFNALPA